MTDFDTCATFTVRDEEGEQKKPLQGDPGGATNWGVTLSRLMEWRGRACTPDDVWALSYDEAVAIFHAGYWNAVRGWGLPAGVNLMVVDHAFNCGVWSSAGILQTLLGVNVDHRIGGITTGTARRVAGMADFLAKLRAAQEADYRTKRDFALFGHEWIGDPQAADAWRRQGRLGRRYAAAMRMLATAA